MATAYILAGSYGAKQPQPALVDEPLPVIIGGIGAPDGDAEPFLSANKGSLYLRTDATDDAIHIYSKVDEGGDDNDWVGFSLDGHTHA